jgi:outer membrane putative beta-barrel porin/alpha-amylase
VFGFAPQLEGVGHTHYANSGFTLGFTPNVQFDLRGGVGLNGSAPDYFVGAGLVRRW